MGGLPGDWTNDAAAPRPPQPPVALTGSGPPSIIAGDKNIAAAVPAAWPCFARETPMVQVTSGHDRPHLPDTHYLDNRIFTDEAIFREEQQNIFAKVWQFACHESEVAGPGDFRCVRVAGHSIVVVRGPDGIVRAF